jgi:hypothetical protein
MKVHLVFGLLTVVLPIIVIGSRRQEAFTFDDVIGMAQAIAAGRHVSTAPVLPKELRDLNYDQHRAIRLKDEYTLWRREDLPFQVRFLHPGYIFDRPIEIFYEVANSAFERLRYSPDFFDFGGNAFRGRFPDTGKKRAPPTAIVLPIFNEDVDRVFHGIEAMWIGLREARGSQGFDFFILSDSNRPESWLRELVETMPGRSNWKNRSAR